MSRAERATRPASRPAAQTRALIGDYFDDIAKHDPEGLLGIRTISEVADRLKINRDTMRYYLEALEDDGRIECIGKLMGEPGKHMAYKAKS